jgi:hypothetical protein
VETDAMAERGEPVLSLVSRTFLNDREGIIEKLASGPYVRLIEWMMQQFPVKGVTRGVRKGKVDRHMTVTVWDGKIGKMFVTGKSVFTL